MTHQPINLHEIDFTQPDGEFIYQGQKYLIKNYLDKYFFKTNSSQPRFFVSSYSDTAKYLCSQKYLNQISEEVMQRIKHRIHSCVQYQDTIFSFGLWGYGLYYSLKYNCWQRFNWKVPRPISADMLLELSTNFSVEQAKIAYDKELPILEDREQCRSFSIEKNCKPIELVVLQK